MPGATGGRGHAAQAGGLLLLPEIPDRDKKLMVFTGIERAKFRRPVAPGDQLRLEVEVMNSAVSCASAEAFHVDGKLACEAVILCAVVPRVPEAPTPRPSAEPPAQPLEAVVTE